MTSNASSVQPHTLVGVALKILSVSVFVAMSSLIKAAGELPAGQIVFYRSFFAIFPILVFLGFRRELRTAFPPGVRSTTSRAAWWGFAPWGSVSSR